MSDKKHKKVPDCIGIIMDGNRRWAKARGKNTLNGHQAGFETLKNATKWAAKAGVKYLIVFAFSTENWKRAKDEVGYLLSIFERALAEDFKKFDEDVRVKFIGDRSQFSEKLQKLMAEVEEESKNKKGITLVPAVSYGGRDEILRAIKKLGESDSPITEESVSNALDTKDVLDPDLIIRTSGEMRLSGFLPWQAVYSELFFTDTLWPDFSKEEFEKILAEYASRQRRFGK